MWSLGTGSREASDDGGALRADVWIKGAGGSCLSCETGGDEEI